jgi:hypothetical protein
VLQVRRFVKILKVVYAENIKITSKVRGATGMNREMNLLDKFAYWVYTILMDATR